MIPEKENKSHDDDNWSSSRVVDEIPSYHYAYNKLYRYSAFLLYYFCPPPPLGVHRMTARLKPIDFE